MVVCGKFYSEGVKRRGAKWLDCVGGYCVRVFSSRLHALPLPISILLQKHKMLKEAFFIWRHGVVGIIITSIGGGGSLIPPPVGVQPKDIYTSSLLFLPHTKNE